MRTPRRQRQGGGVVAGQGGALLAPVGVQGAAQRQEDAVAAVGVELSDDEIAAQQRVGAGAAKVA